MFWNKKKVVLIECDDIELAEYINVTSECSSKVICGYGDDSATIWIFHNVTREIAIVMIDGDSIELTWLGESQDYKVVNEEGKVGFSIYKKIVMPICNCGETMRDIGTKYKGLSRLHCDKCHTYRDITEDEYGYTDSFKKEHFAPINNLCMEVQSTNDQMDGELNDLFIQLTQQIKKRNESSEYKKENKGE